MRLTYSDIKSAHFRNIGKGGQETDTTLVADFNYSLGVRYQQIMGALSSYINQEIKTASTVASQQYYYYPAATVGVDSATITIGSVNYTLTPIYSQKTWNMLNALQIQPTSIPQFIYPRKDDFGIWPIPQAVYTISFQRYYRDRNLQVADVLGTTGVVTLNSVNVTGASGAFTTAMKGRWFTVTSTTAIGQGFWYRIEEVNSATSLDLETYWGFPTASSLSYRIGESPELPEEAHILLPAGTAAEYYAGSRGDIQSATWWNNVFWTGDGNNKERDLDSENVSSGLIGIIKNYSDRDRDNIIRRQPAIISPSYKVWAESIS